MPLLAFEPENDIEHQILNARDEGLSGDALMRQIAEAELFIPSMNDVKADGSGFKPVLLEQNDLAFVAVFTAMSRQPKGMAPTMMRTGGKHFFLRLPPGYGVIFNPGYDAEILLPAHGAQALKRDLQGG
jgi:SseB protein N-terminal domain